METKTETLTLRILPTLKDRIERYAKQEQRSRSQLVSIILDKYVPNYKLIGDSD
jgi:predicted HicB family RNase H-like nuclease